MRRLPVLLALIAASCIVTALPLRVSAATNSNVRVVNLSDHNFSVAWYTDTAVHGSILVGATCATATTSMDEDPNSNGFVHLVSAGGGLDAGTTYVYRVVDDGVASDCASITTLHQFASPPVPSTIDGYVRYPSPACALAAPGSLVTMTLTHNATTSLPLAAITIPSGGYNITIGAATDPSGALMTAKRGDSLTLTAAASSGDTVTVTTAYDPPSNAPQQIDLCLPQAPPVQVATPIPTATLTATPQPSATNTSTPQPTATSTATPRATATGTATRTPVTNTGASPTSTLTPIATIVPTATRTSTAVPSATGTPTGTLPTVTRTPIVPSPTATRTVLPGTQATRTPTSTSTRTAIPTATPTPVPTATNTPVPPTPLVTAEPAPIPSPRPVHIHIRAHLSLPIIKRGQREHVFVTTDRGVHIKLVVTYADRSKPYIGFGKAPKGHWDRHWIVRALKPGKATARLRFIERGRTRYFTLRFTVR